MGRLKKKKGSGEPAKKSKFKEKLDMYDMILANLVAGKSIIEPTQRLDNSQIHIGFSNIASEETLTKYFSIREYPDYIQDKLIDEIRNACMSPGVKVNFYIHGERHKINWDSADMRSKMDIWNKYSDEHDGSINVFNYRKEAAEAKARDRIIYSTKYLHESELEHKRSLVKVTLIIEVSAKRDEESLVNMSETIKKLNEYTSTSGIKLMELRINMIDWLKAINPFSLNPSKETKDKLTKKIMTDDNLANFNSYKQGRIGQTGIPLGVDVLSYCPVFRVFKDDPDKAENWLISAETGGGKSMWVKSILPYALAAGFTVCIMDYEGDEYTNFAYYVRESNPDDVKVVSMGKGSAVYFDPCEIPDLTGDLRVDLDLKESATSFISAIFRVMVHGTSGDFTTEQRTVLSLAIQRMYDSAGVTEDLNTWHRSKGLRLHDVYREIYEMVVTKEFIDGDNDNIKHKAAIKIQEATRIYFEEGEVNSKMFSQPMSANELYKAKLIVFSFGMKGATDSTSDPVMLTLKQMSVAYVNTQISNHCKYVKKCFNIKLWEEFQRWIMSEGAAEIIGNVITGGRKRGDVNFIITNDLASLLDENSLFASKIADNVQNYAIGKIKNKKTREKFCEKFDQMECLPALARIAKASQVKKIVNKKTSGTQNKYKNSFCIILDDGNKAIVKSMLPPSILNSTLFRTGVQIE